MNVTRIVAAFVAAGLVAGSAMAQTKAAPVAVPANDDVLLKQGTILYGGTISWGMDQWSGYGSKEKTSSMNVAPEVSYFIMDNLSIGVIADVSWQRWKYNDGGSETENATEMAAELLGRYYFPLCNNRIIPYVGATLGGGYGFYSDKWGTGQSDSWDGYLTTYGGQTGFLVPLNASVMLDTCVSYKRTERQGSDWNSENKDQGETMLSMGFLIKY